VVWTGSGLEAFLFFEAVLTRDFVVNVKKVS
jgi:hypothetical protein